jgi:hypothetical protein
MTSPANPQFENAVAMLRRFAPKRTLVERCEMCSRELPAEHDHLVDPAQHKLICACTACAILFDGQVNAKYKRVPRGVRFLQDLQMTEGQWETLRVPIDMAFFLHSSPQGRMIALYPSPAGAIESLLPLDTWNELSQANPVLKEMEADVVALLVNRVGSTSGSQPAEYYLAPIDECYKLVGLIRTNWRGLSGGTEVWREISAFFSELKRKSRIHSEAAHV